MNNQIFETDQNMQQIFSHPDNLPSVVSFSQKLDNYSKGSIEFHWHTEFQFGLILKGKTDYSIFESLISRKSHELTAGDGFFINSRVLHGCSEKAAGTEFFSFVMPPTYFASHAFGKTYENIILPTANSEIPGVFFFHDREEDQPVLKLFREFYRLNKEQPDYDINCINLICQIWEILYQRFHNEDLLISSAGISFTHTKWIRSMLDYVHQHYAEPMTVEQIASSVGISKRECYRCFRSIIGKSPIEYLTKFRLATAVCKMTKTDDTLSSISKSCGFESISYFNKCFKKYYGVSPKQFRF